MIRGKNVRFLAVWLCCILIMGWVPPVYAATNADIQVQTEGAGKSQQASDTILITNHDAGQTFKMALENGELVILSLPKIHDYPYAIIGIDKSSKVYPLSGSAIRIPLPEEAGIHYVKIYFGKDKAGTYDGIIFGKYIGIKIENGSASFVKSRIYEYNKSRYQTQSTSETIRGYYKQPSYWIESDSPKIKKLAASIVESTDSDYVKIRKIHDWVANNIWYDWDSYLSGVYSVDAETVLEKKRTVCSGYSNLTAALLRSLGIPAKVVTGYAITKADEEWSSESIISNERNHAWNEVYADGRWIIMDTTWDSDNIYKNGIYSAGTGLSKMLYFDTTLDFFSVSHKIMPEKSYDTYERKTAFENALSISKERITIRKKKTKKISVKSSQKYINLKDAKISYVSSNPGVATVNQAGKIKAKKTGQTYITTKVQLEGITLYYDTSVTVKK